MHTHQTKVSLDARREFGYRIIKRFANPGRFTPLPETFDAFYDILWEIRPEGIGPLTTYDVATRVGAYIKLEPTAIYLHTGARMGWEALWGGRSRIPAQGRVARVSKEVWPPALRQLSADMAEDFLCTYRDALTRIKRDERGRPL